ncbi:MAG TPA: outer membrane beta-barrel domain-containing protein [Kofleriaceae bacterium]
MNRALLGAVLAAALCVRAHAQPAPTAAAAAPTAPTAPTAPSPAKPSDAPLPSCLDQTIAGELGAQLHPRGVQKRNFLKRKHLALVVHGGEYGGDLTSSSWIAGGSLGYFFTEDFGVQGEFDLTPLTLDLDSPLTKFFGDNRFSPGMAYVALGNAVWSPIHAKMKLGGGIVHADILLFAGGGRMFHDAVQGLSFDAGAAIDFFVTRVMTVRLDVRDLTAVEEVAASSRMTNNVIATAGVAFWIPTGL